MRRGRGRGGGENVSESSAIKTEARRWRSSAYAVPLDSALVLHSVQGALVLSSSVEREDVANVDDVGARRRLYGAPNTAGEELEPRVTVR